MVTLLNKSCMRKKSTSILLLLLTGCLLNLYAQQNDFVKGWYITQQNDTLKGFVATEKKENFTSFYFKPAAKGVVTEIPVMQVKMLNMDDQVYKIWFGKRNMEYIDRVDLSLIRNDGVFFSDTIVLKCIYAGQYFYLYNYKDEKDHYFIETRDYIDELLITYDYLTYWERLSMRSYQFPAYWVHNTYKSQIIAMFGEKLDRRTNALLDRTELSKNSLLRLCRLLDDL